MPVFDPKEQWHLDKKVPIAIVFVLIVQTGGWIWFQANLSARVDRLEDIVNSRNTFLERIVRVEEKITTLQGTAQRIESLVRNKP